MAKAQANQPYIDNPDNVDFDKRIERLNEFGLSQQDIAEMLGVSAGQVSRVRRGERHASGRLVKVIRECVREVERGRKRQEIRSRSWRNGNSIFTIDHMVLSRLTATLAVEAFRDLLWARAAEQGIPPTQISISSQVHTSDGGVDASILEDADLVIHDELLASGTRFQIKTGEFKPWQPSKIKNELFKKKAEKFENLGKAVQETLCSGKRFVLVCFGVDTTPTQRRTACKNLKANFEQCGYPHAEVDVWGQTELIGLFQNYPSLCLRLHGHDHQGFRSWMSWSSDDDMQPQVHYSPEQHQLIKQLRNDLRSRDVGHLRLIGEPGVGKTRLALELTGTEELAPITLFVKDGPTFLRSSFINELVQVDDHRFVVLVIDECSRNDRAEIWNRLKSRSNRIRLITVDHGPDDATDERMRVLDVAPAETEQIIAILADHDISPNDARRWATYCEGCPRVAHVIGENLRRNREDLLQTPATTEVWDRFIVGHDDPNSEEVQHRKTVLRYVSLFERFGFDDPVDDEARFIARLSGIPWTRFQSIIFSLKERRILQGTKTLYITPRLLHVYLYREFWRIYGSAFDITKAMEEMPEQMSHWLVQMLRYAHESKSAEAAVHRLLGSQEAFPRDEFQDSQEKGRLIQSLAEASPKATLHCLKRTIGSMSVERLRSLSASRQSIVWALERIAAWEQSFVDSATLLLRLAEAENATNSNNATGTFKQLFSLIPGVAATQAPPSLRIKVLKNALESESAEWRRLGLEACESALSTSGGFRMIGPEYQGLRRTIEFWMPTTYGELWDAYRQVWELLLGKLETWEGEDRSRLISTLISASGSALHIEVLETLVLDALRAVAHDPATDVKALVQLVQRQLRYRKGELSESVKQELLSICEGLEGHDFASRLRRFVKHVTWDDFYDDDARDTRLVDRKLDELADEAIGNRDLLIAELPWLVCEESSPAFCFAVRLGKRDPDRLLLPDLMAHQTLQKQDASTSFLSGYLAAIFDHDAEEWESIMLQLAEDSATANRFSDFVIASGISNRIANKVIEQCRCGAQSKERLERWWFSLQLQKLNSEVMQELITLQLEDGSGSFWSNAVHMCHTFYLEKGNEKTLPEDLIFRVLTHEAMADRQVHHSAAYYWSRLANAFLQQFPMRTWEFFRSVLRASSREWSVLKDLNTNEEHVLTTLLRKDPELAFECIVDVYREVGEQHSFGLKFWLSEGGHLGIGSESSGPIQHVPAKRLFDWVDENIDAHGYWLAGVLPKTFDKTSAGRLTRDFIARYGSDKSISNALHAHFHSRSWCGNASDFYRKLRDEAREWLAEEDDATVIRWIGDYIDGLSFDIERAELDEERWR